MDPRDRPVISARAIGHANGWKPYPHVGGAVAPSTQLGMFTSHSQTKPLTMGSPQSQNQMTAFHHSQEFDLNTSDAHAFQRPNAIHYEDEPPINYTQASPYMLPNGEPGAMMDYGASPWSPKGWDSMFGTGRTSNGSIYPEADTNSSLNQSQFAYMLPSQGHSELPHSSSAAINSIPSSDRPGPDRTLPTPTSRTQQGLASSPNFLPTEGGSNSPWLSGDYKGVFWNPRMTASPNQRSSSTHTVPSNATLANAPDLKNVNMNNTAPELLFTYLPMPTISEDTNIAVPSSSAALTGPSTSTTSSVSPTYSMLDTLDTTATEYPTIPSTTRIARHSTHSSRDHSSSHRLHALANECAPDIYGYSSNEKSKARGSGSDSETRTLVSGLPYTRVQHRDPPGGGFSFNLLPDALPEYHRAVVENVHRPPIEPLGNQGAY